MSSAVYFRTLFGVRIGAASHARKKRLWKSRKHTTGYEVAASEGSCVRIGAVFGLCEESGGATNERIVSVAEQAAAIEPLSNRRARCEFATWPVMT